MTLDLRTLFLSFLICNCSIVFIMIPLWRNNKTRYKGIHLWVTAFLLLSVGNLFFVARDKFPEILSIFMGNASFATGLLLLIIGLYQFFDQKSTHRFDIGLVIVFVISIFYFSAFYDAINVRAISLCVVFIIQMAEIFFLINNRIDKEYRKTARPIAVVAGLFIITMLARIGIVVAHPIHGGFYQAPQVSLEYCLIVSQVLAIIMAISLFYAVTSRLTFELKMYHRELEQKVEQRTQQLLQAEKLSSLGILAAGVAHEISNPNNFIMLNAPLLRKGWECVLPILNKLPDLDKFKVDKMDLPAFLTHVIRLADNIGTGAERIQQIVSDLSQYSHPLPQSQKSVHDLNEIVNAAVRLIDNYVHKKTENFEIALCAEPLTIRGNFQKLEQVTINLLRNACEALADKTKKVRIETKCSNDRNEALLVVTDEGCGIDEDDLIHITEPFYTTKREFGGTGLGLSVSYTIITEHNGTISFESKRNQGTTVTVALPAQSV